MKKRFKFLPLALVLCSALGLAACEGDQGEIGPKGDPGVAGTNGTTGANGATGANGEDGQGFEELTQYGNIEVTLSGKRIDEINFSQTADFIYMPTYGGVSQNSVAYHDANNDTYYFNISRENKGKVESSSSGRTSDGGVKNSVWLGIAKDAEGVTVNNFQIYADVVTTDFKTFEVNHDNGSWNNDFDMTVTDYTYVAATGKLTFNFAYTIPAVNSNTGFDISVTGKVNVIVFQSLNPI